MQRLQGALTRRRMVPVIYDQDEFVVQRRLYKRNPVKLICGSVWSVKHVDVKAAELCIVNAAEVIFKKRNIGVGSLKAFKVLDKLRLRSAELRPIINPGGTNNVPIDRGTQG